MRKNAGFTLIELLVTMTLLLMIILVGSSALGLYGQRWNGQLGQFDRVMREARNLVLVQEVIDSLTPYIAYNEKGQPFVYFEGNRNGFVAVSNRSLYRENVHAVIRFSVRQNSDLNYDVLYEEWAMRDEVLRSTRQPVKFSEPIILFSSVRNPLFQYLGWASRLDRDGDGEGSGVIQPLWLADYNGLDLTATPLKVKLTFTAPAGDYTLLSSLSSAHSSALYRYQGSHAKQRRSDEPGEYVDDNCYCE